MTTLATKNVAYLATDETLIRSGRIDELAVRFGDKEFVVSRSHNNGVTEWVASIDTYDGNTEWTANPKLARFFRGAEWVHVWASPGHRLLSTESLPIG